MATLTITVPDVYNARISKAIGMALGLEDLATPAQVEAWLKRQIRAKVIQYESALASSEKEAVLIKEAW